MRLLLSSLSLEWAKVLELLIVSSFWCPESRDCSKIFNQCPTWLFRDAHGGRSMQTLRKAAHAVVFAAFQ